VLFFIQLSTRRVVAAGARQALTRRGDEQASSAAMLRTPLRAPKANAYAERWVQTVQVECLDWTLLLGQRHLRRLLRGDVRHHNQQRPHRGLALAVPEAAGGSHRR
jgi:hypothetical protein